MGQPACPIACQYCHVTELDADRTKKWSEGLLGINKACTFVNIPPWISQDKATQKRFIETPWYLLDGETVGWTAVTDGFMPQLRPYFWHWVEQLSDRVKCLTVVTKWPLKSSFVKELAKVKNLLIVVTITGNSPPVEKVSAGSHLVTLALLKEAGVPALPMCHPYIAGVSDLSFLPKLKELGYDRISIKGLRYNPLTMQDIIPPEYRHYYEGKGIEEILPEDSWRDRVNEAGLTLLSPQQWYQQWTKANAQHKAVSLGCATENVNELWTLCQVASSHPNEVKMAAINRRL